MTTKAKFYVYRNLNAGGFSIKHRGKVIYRFGSDGLGWVCKPQFQVSEVVSAKVKATKTRSVHAYVVSNNYGYMSFEGSEPLDKFPTLRYNPHHDTEFSASDGSDLSLVEYAAFFNDKVYLMSSKDFSDLPKWWS
ncbi:hypothetical protein Xoosp13_74 [Xanthomonas phage Xoo-sp13]|nr:hypothetical protein Xoosp13_74 [Xanthomonas phage Xoo-sp13]